MKPADGTSYVPRRIIGLKTAARLLTSPFPKSHLTERQKKGLAFEKKVVARLEELWPGRVLHGPWFEFEDANGHGYCQADVLVNRGDWLMIVEAKLTQQEKAWLQLEGLYMPVVELLWPGVPLARVQATGFLNGYAGAQLVSSPEKVVPGDTRWLWLL
jgi:hypothetical protein